MKRKHSGVQETNISRNSNESIQDENYNPDIINKLYLFTMDDVLLYLFDYLW